MEDTNSQKLAEDVEILPTSGSGNETENKNPLTDGTEGTNISKDEYNIIDIDKDQNIDGLGIEIKDIPQQPTEIKKPEGVIIPQETKEIKKTEGVIFPQEQKPKEPEQIKEITSKPELQKLSDLPVSKKTEIEEVQKIEEQKTPIQKIKEEALSNEAPKTQEVVRPPQTPKETQGFIKPSQPLKEEAPKPQEIIKPSQQPKTEVEEKTKEDNKKSGIKTVRTFQEDVARMMKEQKTSLTKILTAEQKKNELTGKIPTEKEENKNILKTILIILGTTAVVGLIGFTGFYYYNQQQNQIAQQITELQIPSFIFSNYQRELFFDSLNRDNVVNEIEKLKDEVSVPLGSIIQIYPTIEDKSQKFKIVGEDEFKLIVTAESFLNALDSRAPAVLKRALMPDFIFGFHSSLGNNPFLLFKINSYNNAFAGMLDWEKNMISDLFPIFERYDSKIDKNNYAFQDIIVKNIDVRAILNQEGKIEFAYFFPDRETLAIVNNETTIQEIVRRVQASKLERTTEN